MKISYNWLKTLLDFDCDSEEVAKLLTSVGLEVESIENFENYKGSLKGLVIGEVIEKTKHPDADKLSLTKVSIGKEELLNIVCGAPNVEAGQKVVVATIGATLYPTSGEPFEIKKSKIRGQVSEGMLCAEDEIGLGQSHAGIMVLDAALKTGTPLSEVFEVYKDEILEIGLTPNRGDAASHLGVARDLSAVLNIRKEQNTQIHLKNYIASENVSGSLTIEVEVENPELCPRYSGLTINGITVKDSPDWLQNKLKAVGLRPINSIVDITNYVQLETGQPLHAFDALKLEGKKIVVRKAKPTEKFVTLDGIEREMHGNELLICDANKPACLAGIFGGQNSGVSSETGAVFLEAAYFDPGVIRSGSKIHGLKTDASFRFERGTDPEMTIYALRMARDLILEIAGGTVSSEEIDFYPEKLEPYKVAFSYVNCDRLIGKDIDRALIRKCIISLGIQVITEGNDGLLLEVPRFKSDVKREADVIEEVLRLIGYDQIDVADKLSYALPYTSKNKGFELEDRISNYLVSNGFYELMTTSLSKENYYSDTENLIKIVNPLSSDLNVMRKSLLYSALECAAYNINRKIQDLKLFEWGKIYQISDSDFPYQEFKQVSILLSGNNFPLNHFGASGKSDFFSLKAIVEKLFQLLGIPMYETKEFSSQEISYGLAYYAKEKLVAKIGEVSKKTLKQFDIEQEVFFAELNEESLENARTKTNVVYKEVVKFPEVKRDLSLLLDKSVRFEEVIAIAHQTEKKILKDVLLFDVYEGEKIEQGKKSYAISLILQDEQNTLTDEQIDKTMKKIINAYEKELSARLRD